MSLDDDPTPTGGEVPHADEAEKTHEDEKPSGELPRFAAERLARQKAKHEKELQALQAKIAEYEERELVRAEQETVSTMLKFAEKLGYHVIEDAAAVRVVSDSFRGRFTLEDGALVNSDKTEKRTPKEIITNFFEGKKWLCKPLAANGAGSRPSKDTPRADRATGKLGGEVFSEDERKRELAAFALRQRRGL